MRKLRNLKVRLIMLSMGAAIALAAIAPVTKILGGIKGLHDGDL